MIKVFSFVVIMAFTHIHGTSANANPIIEDLSSREFVTGTYEWTTQVGSGVTKRTRIQRSTLNNIDRQGGDRNGFRFNAEADSIDESVMRLVRFELPPTNLWLETGEDSITATQTVVFDQVGNVTRQPKTKRTDIRVVNGILYITQLTTHNGQFVEQLRWTLK